jgi:hypothetical protein
MDNFFLKTKFHWDLQYLENLMPWQRDMYIDMAEEELNKS